MRKKSKRPITWSYSMLTSYETCPRKHYLTRVSKQVEEKPGVAMLYGNAAHKALEERMRDGTPLPPEVSARDASGNEMRGPTEKWNAVTEALSRVQGVMKCEQKIALTRTLSPTKFFASDAWVRGVVDFMVVNDTKILALDYKTGKRKPDSDQLKLFAAMLLNYNPHAEKVITGFIWLKTGQIDRRTYTREDLPEIWGAFIPRVKRLYQAHKTDEWEPRPSGLCRGWCPCTSCEFHQEKH